MQTSTLIILLIASVQGIQARVTRTRSRLPAPQNTHLVAFDPYGLVINWERIDSKLERVLGYKVRLWEAQEKKTYTFKNVNGRRVLVEDLEKPKLMDFSVGEGKLLEYMLDGPDQTQLVVNLKPDTPYLIQILAFGPSGDGEVSADVGIELHSPGSTVPNGIN